MEPKQETKSSQFNIEKSFKEKLKLYFIIVRPSAFPPVLGEHVRGILAYRTEDALARAKQDESDSKLIFIYTGNFVYVDELLKNIKTKGMTIISAPEPIKPQEKGLEGLKAGLIMLAEEYIEEKEDKKELKRIIKKIKEKTP